jgi:hypothetical protein
MVIDALSYYRKLLPSYERSIDTTREEALAVVECGLAGCRKLSKSGSWRYDINFHLALAELRDALIAEIAQAKVAA